MFVQEWYTKLELSSKGRNYGIFKQDLIQESYLTSLPRNAYITMIKFRTSNYKLPVETGRWEGIPHNERKCSLCEKNDIGDDFHYMLICPFFRVERADLLKPYYYTRPNIVKYKDLLTCRNKSVLLKLSKFMKIITTKFP